MKPRPVFSNSIGLRAAMTMVPILGFVLVSSTRTIAEIPRTQSPADSLSVPNQSDGGVSCVRLPSVSSTNVEDAARDSVWEPVAEPKAIDLSQVLPTNRTEAKTTRLLPPVEKHVAVRMSPPPPVTAAVDRQKRLQKAVLPRTTAALDWKSPDSNLAAAAQRADEKVHLAMALADKGAVYAGREEFIAALQAIAQSLDVHYGTQEHCEWLSEGLLAMQEAGDYLPNSGSATIAVNVATVAANHHSLGLEGFELDRIDAITAARLHFAYAQKQMVAALGGSPVASRSLYGLGKFCMLRAEQVPTSTQANTSRAMAFHQAALLVDPANPVAGNELGVLLARQGRLTEARDVLRRCVTVNPTPESWRNLTVVYERLGELGEAHRTRAAWQYAAAVARNTSPGLVTATDGTSVHWVDRNTFERGSRAQTPAFEPRPEPSGNGVYTNRPASMGPWIR